MRRLRQYFKTELAEIIAYCLMPNHYHLLVYIKCDDAGLGIMQPFVMVAPNIKTNNQQK